MSLKLIATPKRQTITGATLIWQAATAGMLAASCPSLIDHELQPEHATYKGNIAQNVRRIPYFFARHQSAIIPAHDSIASPNI